MKLSHLNLARKNLCYCKFIRFELNFLEKRATLLYEYRFIEDSDGCFSE